MLSIKNCQISLYCHFNKIIKEPGTSLQSPVLSQKHFRNVEIPLLVMPIMMSQILKSVDFTKAQKSRYLENKISFFLHIKKVGITKPCTYLLHLTHFSLNLALCNTLNIIRTKIVHVIG